MKAKKLEAIVGKYPWLERELMSFLESPKPDHRKLEFVAIQKMDNLGQFGDARVELQYGFPSLEGPEELNDLGTLGLWGLVTWSVLFCIGDEKTLRGRSVAFPNDEDRRDEQTVTQVIQYINNWYKEYWEAKAPIEFVAVVKKVFRGQGSIPFPTRVTVYLFN